MRQPRTFLEKQTSVIRYWFVSDKCRDQGVGSKLMKTFFNQHSTVKRTLLWVITSNKNAITRYKHYGFMPDALVDQVMTKGAV